jgi:hypothetical protein
MQLKGDTETLVKGNCKQSIRISVEISEEHCDRPWFVTIERISVTNVDIKEEHLTPTYFLIRGSCLQ